MASQDDSSSAITRGPQLEQSPLDPRSYRAVTLRNQLDVLIVSDTASDKAAASLDVAVGNFSDPKNLPGLAHFLEHMLFLGTAKYPEEGSYNNFLAENGGHSNAFTASENTNYHFTIVVADKAKVSSETSGSKMPKFKEALDRFAQFFTAPLFTESATERELNAVDSEHQKNLQSDSRRMYQVKKEVANREHPYSNFGTGSKETLGETPEKTGVDTRAALLKFHKTYYSANLMKLCIIGPYSVDIMEEWVTELFSDIPNRDRGHPSETYQTLEPLLEEHKGLRFFVETIKDIRHLEMSWITPPCIRDYRSKPLRYIANLLGDEGEGSILSLLKKRGWCDSLSVGMTHQETFSFLQLTATLTNSGADHTDEIVSLVYQYLRMVKDVGIQEWLFNEEKTLAANSFRFMEKYDPLSFVTYTSSHMHNYAPEEYLSGPYLFKEYNLEKINSMFAHLTPENGNVIVAGKFTSGKTSRKERWYETPYHVEKVPQQTLEIWNAAACDPDIHIPAPNPFIPTDFELLCQPLPKGEVDEDGPQMIFRNDFVEVHHKLDRSFERPKASIVMHLGTPLAYRCPLHAVMANLLTCLLEDELTEFSYPAERAGFHYQVDQVATGIQLVFRGYSHRIDVLVDAVIRKIATFVADPIRFDMQKDALKRNYANFDKGQPYSRVLYNVSQLLEEPRWHVNEYLARIQDGSVTVEAVNEYAKAVRKKLFVTALVCGNIGPELAIAMAKSVQSVLGYKPLPEAEQLKKRVVQVPVGKDIYTRMAHPNPDDNNSAIEVFFQTGPRGDLVHDVKVELMGDILNKPTFHELRTVQQLGYIVFEGVGGSDAGLGLFVIVQSTVADPDDLLYRIDKFLGEARKDILEEMTDEKLEQYVSSLSVTKAQPDTNLVNQTWRFWSEIDNGFLLYDRKQREIEVLQSINREDMLEFFDTYIAPGGSQRRRVISQVYGNQHPLEDKKTVGEDAVEVRNRIAFRRQCALYPVVGKHDVTGKEKQNGML